jgi:hypothetical protein|tara:strand:+ start:378 stop:662 length:285 start_codon:yes stop_codon:yes gene_type:complete
MNLPDGFPHKPPEGYSYEVKEHKRNMVSIWLRNHASFSYTSDPVRTIWGFYNTKKGCYHAPINSTKHGNQIDIKDTRDYTAMQLNLNPLMRAFL